MIYERNFWIAVGFELRLLSFSTPCFTMRKFRLFVSLSLCVFNLTPRVAAQNARSEAKKYLQEIAGAQVEIFRKVGERELKIWIFRLDRRISLAICISSEGAGRAWHGRVCGGLPGGLTGWSQADGMRG